MTPPIQCDNCGAVLQEEDLFCGECSAPRPSVIAPAQVVEQPQASEPPDSDPVRRRDSDRGWRVAAAILGIGGALLCLLGLAAFLLLGTTGGEGLTQTDSWLISAICCLFPVGGAGIVAAVAGLVIWWARLRDR